MKNALNHSTARASRKADAGFFHGIGRIRSAGRAARMSETLTWPADFRSRYIHTGEAETYRPIPEIVADLEAIEAEARKTDAALKEILRKIGFW